MQLLVSYCILENDRCIVLCATVCSAPDLSISENTAGVLGIIPTLNLEITLAFISPPADNPFSLNGNQLRVDRPLDFEVETVAILGSAGAPSKTVCRGPAIAIVDGGGGRNQRNQELSPFH